MAFDADLPQKSLLLDPVHFVEVKSFHEYAMQSNHFSLLVEYLAGATTLD
jgi:hypothetical protein